MKSSEPENIEWTVAEIIEALTPYTGRFPLPAVQAAMAQPEAVTPPLLQCLETVAAAPEEFAPRDYMLHMFALYLLAQFREKRACRPLVRLLNGPAEVVDDLLGDTITEGLQNILGSVYDGDPEPLLGLIEADHVNEFVRGSCVEAFLVLAYTGQMTREEVARYFAGLFGGRLKRKHGQVWNELACAVSDLPAPELLPELRRAYDEGLVDDGYARLESLEYEARDGFEPRLPKLRAQFALTQDAVTEMEWWAAFHPDPEPLSRRKSIPEPVPLTALPANPPPPSPAPAPGGIRRTPKVGRNEPCPCGSGKKHKKCCLGRDGAAP